VLLGIDTREQSRVLCENVEDVKEGRVVQADVQRSCYSWDIHTRLPDSKREHMRADLRAVIVSVIKRHEGKMTYFQGLHDIALVFLEVSKDVHLATLMTERFALYYISDYLCWSFDQGLLPLTDSLGLLVRHVDPEVGNFFDSVGMPMHFAVPWVLTLLSHTLHGYEQVVRMFDCLLCSHPATILYFCCAMIVKHRTALLEAEQDMASVHHFLQSLPWDSETVDSLAPEVLRLQKIFSPEKFTKSLRTVRLPPTSPMLNYPFQWLRNAQIQSVPAARAVQDAPIYWSRLRFVLAKQRWGLLQAAGLASCAAIIAAASRNDLFVEVASAVVTWTLRTLPVF